MKILVVTRITSFITDMMDDWRDKKGYEVKLIPEYNEADVTWADVIICDFVDNRLQSVAEHPLAHKKIVIGRLHRVEWYKGQPRAGLKWENVNYLVFTGKYFLDMFNQSARKNMIKNCKAIHIPYGIDLEKFNFKERKPGLNIAWVAKSYWARKDPARAISLVYALRKHSNKDYQLHMAGAGGDRGMQDYIRYLKSVRPELNEFVHECGYHGDINAFLEDKDFALVTSINESFCYAVGEPMAKGIKTILWDFEPADTIWPREYTIFSDQEFFDLIEGPYESAKYRQYIKDNYSLEAEIEEFERLLSS